MMFGTFTGNKISSEVFVVVGPNEIQVNAVLRFLTGFSQDHMYNSFGQWQYAIGWAGHVTNETNHNKLSYYVIKVIT